MPEKEQPKSSVYAIGGGKGGTGKSFLAAALAVELGRMRGDTVAIDADLGGPNLHSLLQASENGLNLGDFLRNRVPRLVDVLSATSYPGVRLIKGSDHILFLANLPHSKKLKLIRQIKNIAARDVVIDLGTGSAYNTLDLFILGRPGILVVTPEPTAVENMYFFLKSCAVRIMTLYSRYFKISGLEEKIGRALETNENTLRSFFASLASENVAAGKLLLSALRQFRLGLVVNQARRERDFSLGVSIADVVRRYFLIDLELLGTLPFDERALLSLAKRTPFTVEYPESEISLRIKEMAARLIQQGQRRASDQGSLPKMGNA